MVLAIDLLFYVLLVVCVVLGERCEQCIQEATLSWLVATTSGCQTRACSRVLGCDLLWVVLLLLLILLLLMMILLNLLVLVVVWLIHMHHLLLLWLWLLWNMWSRLWLLMVTQMLATTTWLDFINHLEQTVKHRLLTWLT